MSLVKLDKKLYEKSEKIIAKLAELKEIVADKPEEYKQQTLEYLEGLISQVEDFEEELRPKSPAPEMDEWEVMMRKNLASPEKYKNVQIEDIPLKAFKSKK